MKAKFFLFLSATIFLGIVLQFQACEFFRDRGPDSIYITDTITHSAFDFSAGEIPADYNNADGETINWSPQGTHPDYPNNDQWVWWRTSDYTSENQKDYGVVDFNAISSKPGTWDNPVNPLIKGHCYVVQCNDGFVKFKVIDTGFHDWDVAIEYQFSSTGTF